MASSSNVTGPNELQERSFNMDTIQDRMKHLLATGHDSDVHFVFGNDGEEKEIIKAHKIVLAPASPYFAARFHFDNNAANQQQPIVVIKDIEAKPSTFRAVLDFLYTNAVSLINADNFLEVYALSKKFLLPALAKQCAELASTMLNANNALSAWRLAKMHDETALINQCWAFIDNYKISALVANGEFKSLNQDEIVEIFGRDTLRETELYLFLVLNQWAHMKHAEEHPNGIEPTAEVKRAIIGPALYAIRFPLISPKDFINQIVPTGILNKDEMLGMFLHYAEDSNADVKAKYPVKFSTYPRAILFTQVHNKLVDKQKAEQEKQNLTQCWTREVLALRDNMKEANRRLRACGQHGVQY